MAHPKEISRLLKQEVSYCPGPGQARIRLVLTRREKDGESCVGTISETGEEIPFSTADVIVRGHNIINIGRDRI